MSLKQEHWVVKTIWASPRSFFSFSCWDLLTNFSSLFYFIKWEMVKALHFLSTKKLLPALTTLPDLYISSSKVFVFANLVNKLSTGLFASEQTSTLKPSWASISNKIVKVSDLPVPGGPWINVSLSFCKHFLIACFCASLSLSKGSNYPPLISCWASLEVNPSDWIIYFESQMSVILLKSLLLLSCPSSIILPSF